MRPEASSLRRNIVLVAAAACAARVLIGWSTWRAVRASAERGRWVAHSQEVGAALDSARDGLTLAESQELLYALTGDKARLDSFKMSERRTRQLLARLWDLTSDDPAQQARMGQIAKSADGYLVLADSAVGARKAAGPAGTASIAQALRLIDEARAEEDRLFAQRSAAQDSSTQRTLTRIAWVAILSLAAILLFAGWLLRAIARLEA